MDERTSLGQDEQPENIVLEDAAALNNEEASSTRPSHEISEGEEDDPDKPEEAGTSKRPRCKYGKECYRKNKKHKSDFSHPGDGDFIEDSARDDRPSCSYGAACYRKNPQHLRDFNHKRSTRNKTNANWDSDEESDPFGGSSSDEFEGDSDESSSDSGQEESDASLKSGQEESEETERLVREARKFLRKPPR